MANSGKQHCQAIKKILRYLKSTNHVYLNVVKDKTNTVGYVHSDYVTHKRRSTTDYVFILGGCVICNAQPQSTAEP